LKDSKFVMHHIGARNGVRGVPIMSSLEHEFISVMYEASADGNDQILNRGNRMGTSETILVNACVGRPEEKRTFYLNLDPYTSSLLTLNPKYQDYYLAQGNYDYVLGQTVSTHAEEVVKTESLDDLISSRNLPHCDFLSLDTQGSELEILQFAQNTIDNCVGLKLEVSFVEIYKDQPLFGDINKFLIDRNFRFVKFTAIEEFAPRELGEDFWGDKMQMAGDAIYLREPTSLSPSQVYPAVFAALAFGQTEFAMHIYRRYKDQTIKSVDSDWARFCDKFFCHAGSIVNNRKTFGELYSVEKSFARFKDSGPAEFTVTDLRSFAIKIYRSLPENFQSVVLRIYRLYRKIIRLRDNPIVEQSKVEILYESIGNVEVCKSLKSKRNI